MKIPFDSYRNHFSDFYLSFIKTMATLYRRFNRDVCDNSRKYSVLIEKYNIKKHLVC